MKIELSVNISATASGVEFPTAESEMAPEFADTLESLSQYSDVSFDAPELPVTQIVVQNPHVIQTTDRPVPFTNRNPSGEHFSTNAAAIVAIGPKGQNSAVDIVRHPNATHDTDTDTDTASKEAGRLHPKKSLAGPLVARGAENIIPESDTKTSPDQSPKPTFELPRQATPNTVQTLRQDMQIPAKNKVSGVKQDLAFPVENIGAGLDRPIAQTTVVEDSQKPPVTGIPTADVALPNRPVQKSESDSRVATLEKRPSVGPIQSAAPEAAPQIIAQLARRPNAPPVVKTTEPQPQSFSRVAEQQTTVVDTTKTKGPKAGFVAGPISPVAALVTQPQFIDNLPSPNGTIIEFITPVTVAHERSFESQGHRISQGMYRSMDVAKAPPINHSEIPKTAEPTAAFLAKPVDPGLTPDIVIAEIQTGQITPTRTNVQPLVASPEFTPQVIRTIAGAAANLQDRPVELTLNPEELGRVRLTLQNSDGNMSVAVSVERPETLELLRRHIDMLANQLREIGYKEISFEFSNRENSFAEHDPSQQEDQPDGTSGPVPDQVPEPVRISLTGPGRVDIRL